MIERVVKSALGKVGKALDPDELVESNPLNFQLYYADRDGRAEMINTVYLEDGNPKLDLYLEVFNESSGSIAFASPNTSSASRLSTVAPGGTSSASADKCHFSIRWEKDLKIKPGEIELEQAGKWQVNYDEDSHYFILYFLSKETFVLQSKNLENDLDRILLKFKNFTANNRDVKTSNVELLYGSPLLLNSEGEGFTDLISCKNAISVTNHPDDKNIPLQFRFIGPNTILNDGTTQNSLKLQIINRPSSNNTRPNLLLDKANSKFIVDFEIGNGAEALIPTDKADNIEITTSNPDWNVTATQNETAVKVDLKTNSTKDKLVSGETIELEIKRIVTSNPSGVSFLYITYQNIGNYPDGRLVVPVEKTPLLYRGTDGKQVGIGTTSPSEKLEVSGNIKATGAIQPSAGNVENKGIMFPKNPGSGSNLSGDAAWIRYYPRTGESCTLEIGISNDGTDHIALMPTNGNVGIGTITPLAKLHVNGDAIVSGKVGIGITNPSEMLDVNGTIHLSGNITGKDQRLCIYSHTKEEYSGASIELWGNQNSDSTRTGELSLMGKYINFLSYSPGMSSKRVGMKLTSEGNVGIGTTTPSAKLHVSGGNAIFNDKVGIGLSDPAQKLHIKDGNFRIDNGEIQSWGPFTFRSDVDKSNDAVLAEFRKQDESTAIFQFKSNGDFHIKGQKPMEYRVYERSQDNPTITTDYDYQTWIAIVAGFSGYDNTGSNWQASGIKVWPFQSGSKWVIQCDLGYITNERWQISVLFIKRELVNKIN